MCVVTVRPSVCACTSNEFVRACLSVCAGAMRVCAGAVCRAFVRVLHVTCQFVRVLHMLHFERLVPCVVHVTPGYSRVCVRVAYVTRVCALQCRVGNTSLCVCCVCNTSQCAACVVQSTRVCARVAYVTRVSVLPVLCNQHQFVHVLCM